MSADATTPTAPDAGGAPEAPSARRPLRIPGRKDSRGRIDTGLGAANGGDHGAPGVQGSTGVRVARGVLITVFMVLVLIPMYVLLVTSLKAPGDIRPSSAWSLPTSLSFEGWGHAWDQLGPPLYRSVILAVSAAVVSSVLGSLNGFVFAKWRFPGSNVVFTLFLFGMFIPYQAVMIPLQGMLLDVQGALPWFDGIVKLIVVHSIFGIPICTLIFRNYYATAVPTEMLEAARVDGAEMLRTFRSIVLPLSAPAFVVTMIWQFTSAWNDFLFALFLTTRNNGPVTYALNELAGGQNPDYSSIMAGVLIASLPTLLVYIVLGRYFISGLMSGSVK
ncbi:carbohydrate ABC transporter permease [Phycicoccus endophyticus]|uniref:Carbohydrate ABC transporter permease n=1 Tax=Phycicoccus endophyticus TaxID=1690220 RepID=A0A7G9R0K3_9MICO|nr:carbohydrate ABC transporter permease [Phycicoccus endophyticus]NHI19407.1 carbohydrate ABC transporter permease [Phycicoccus endophyticus]QNN49128.1 carbohydrate ABC transporter permease [Phycicoccus endophyticus]GGL38821.1 ABC transporter permease [Phycicoccus endophyticus]